jgi:hypothetical protein
VEVPDINFATVDVLAHAVQVVAANMKAQLSSPIGRDASKQESTSKYWFEKIQDPGEKQIQRYLEKTTQNSGCELLLAS